MTNTERARDLAEKMCGPNYDPILVHVARAFRDAAWREGVEVAAHRVESLISHSGGEGAIGRTEPELLHIVVDAIRGLLPPDPVTAPGHTDLMVAPESVDAPDAVGALAVLRSYEQWEADLIMDRKAWTGTDGLPHITRELWGRLLEIQTARNAALALARRGDGG